MRDFEGWILALIIGGVIGATITYTVLTLQAIQRAQKLAQTSSVLFDRDNTGRMSAIHYVRGEGTQT